MTNLKARGEHLGADHLTLDGGGGVISGHQEFFFSSSLVGRIFFSLFFP